MLLFKDTIRYLFPTKMAELSPQYSKKFGFQETTQSNSHLDQMKGKSFMRILITNLNSFQNVMITLPYTTSFASCPDREIQQNAQFLSSLELTLFFSRKENFALPE